VSCLYKYVSEDGAVYTPYQSILGLRSLLLVESQGGSCPINLSLRPPGYHVGGASPASKEVDSAEDASVDCFSNFFLHAT
jgi:hypothetical protein